MLTGADELFGGERIVPQVFMDLGALRPGAAPILPAFYGMKHVEEVARRDAVDSEPGEPMGCVCDLVVRHPGPPARFRRRLAGAFGDKYKAPPTAQHDAP